MGGTARPCGVLDDDVAVTARMVRDDIKVI